MTGSALLELVDVMDRLRTHCAWDARQTHRTLVEYLLEETHETIEAIETDDLDGLREELGDLLLQVVFHARIASEVDPGWDIEDVAAGIVAKLVRRHPHVFGTDSEYSELAPVGTSDEETLTRNWAVIKAAEKARTSAVAGIPATLPALAWAQKSWRRAVEAGIRADDLASPIDEQVPADEDQLAEQLLALVIAAESQGWDAEASLRGRVRELHRNIQQAESDMRQAETGMRPAEAGFGPGESRLGGAP